MISSPNTRGASDRETVATEPLRCPTLIFENHQCNDNLWSKTVYSEVSWRLSCSEKQTISVASRRKALV